MADLKQLYSILTLIAMLGIAASTKSGNCTDPNQIYRQCGPVCGLTCRTRKEACSKILSCATPQCYCKEGYSLSDDNICVPVSQCDKYVKCKGPNEVYMSCGPNCEATCATLNEPCNINYIVCPSGCYCRKGFARDGDNICILKKDCKKCDKN